MPVIVAVFSWLVFGDGGRHVHFLPSAVGPTNPRFSSRGMPDKHQRQAGISLRAAAPSNPAASLFDKRQKTGAKAGFRYPAIAETEKPAHGAVQRVCNGSLIFSSFGFLRIRNLFNLLVFHRSARFAPAYHRQGRWNPALFSGG